MKKLTLDKNEVFTYIKTNWTLYASECINGKLHRLWFNGVGEFKVTVGDEITLVTKDLGYAVKLFNEF